jgi:hypothetical protein
MNKELLLKVATGNLAKVLRYAATTWGAADFAASTDWGRLEGAITVVLAFVWSMVEDYIKRKNTPAVPSP